MRVAVSLVQKTVNHFILEFYKRLFSKKTLPIGTLVFKFLSQQIIPQKREIAKKFEDII